jgi:TP901 family phage tail tape measure protein
MNIRIQVMANQARQAIQQVQGDISKLGMAQAASAARTGGATAGMAAWGQQLMKSGSKLQWMGRQLTYNFTMPIALATAAGVKFSNDNARAMTELIKVYGDGTMATSQIKSETDALGRSFEAMSEIYGVSRDQVIGIGAAWASAGSSGKALAVQTKVTMDAMVLGGLSAADATQSLIAIQAQYGLSTEQLQYTIAQLNAVENQTGTTMGDLIQSMARSSGVAKMAGVDVAHLAAMTAALVPAAGSASTAGNALKTIISRLLAPTKDARDLLHAMNIDMADTSWNSADASTRLQILSKRFEGLSDAQKQVVSSAVASRLQLNKFDVLMDALAKKGDAAGNGMSYYYQALKAVGDGLDENAARTKVMKIYQDELNAVLDSSPKKFDRMKVMLQNTLADGVQPLLPMLIGLGGAIATIAKKFNDLPNNVQKDIVVFALFLALLGPIATKIGALKDLVGMLVVAFSWLLKPLFGAVTLFYDLAAAIVTTSWAILSTGVMAAGRAFMFLGTIAFKQVVGAFRLMIPLMLTTTRVLWITMSIAWANGIRSIRTLTMLGFRAVWAVARGVMMQGISIVLLNFRVMWAALMMTTLVGGKTVGGLFATSFGLMAKVMAALGPVLSGMWRILMIGLEIITVEVGAGIRLAFEKVMVGIETIMIVMARALGATWRATMILLEFATMEIGAGFRVAFQKLMFAIEWSMIVMAKALGITWRATLITLEVITAELGSGIAGIWRALQATLALITMAGGKMIAAAGRAAMILFEYTLIAGAAVAGGIWRAFIALWVAIQTGGGRLLAAAGAATMALFETTLVAGAAVAGGIWRALQWSLVTITAVGGRAIVATWAAVQAGMNAVTSISWSGIKGVVSKGMGGIMAVVRGGGSGLLKLFTNPWVLAAAAVIAVIIIFHKQIGQIFQNLGGVFHRLGDNIVAAFHKLPQGVQQSIMAVVNMIAAAAKAVYHWFSYLNPWAHHSPSLVENVTSGMTEVTAQFGRLSAIKGPIDNAYVSIRNFKNAAADLANGYDSIKTANEVADLSKAGASQGVISSYINLAHQLSVLKGIQDQYQNAINAQQGVVDGWQKKLDAANKTLDAQQKILDRLKSTASDYSDQISKVKDDLNNLTATPIQGMQQFDDAIFSNQMAQKRLQLQIAQLKQSATGDFKSITDQAAALQGQIETIMGMENNARSAGAGSEITGAYDAQIKQLQAQKAALGTSAGNGASQVDDLQKQLDDLANQGSILDLQKSLQFDGLTRQIDQAANSMQELPFDQILAGVNADKAAIADLTNHYNAANAAVDAQQKVVDQAQASVDAVQASYDSAKDSLNGLKDSYDAVTQAIQDMNQAMSDANAAAQGLKAAKDPQLSPTMQNFNDAAGGNFADVGGSGMVGREGGMGDQSAAIDDYTKQLQDQMKSAFGGFDMFGPFKDMWNGFVKWWQTTAWPWIKKIAEPFTHIFDGISFSDIFGNVFGGVDWSGIFTSAWNTITNVVSTVWDFAKMVWDFIGPDVKDIINQIIGFFKTMGEKVGGVWGDIKERIKPFMEAIGNLWNFLKPFLMFVAGEFVAGIIFAFKLIKNIINPILTFIGDMFSALWEIIRGVLDMFIGIFTGDWKRVWDGFLSIFKGVWDVFLAILKGIGGLIWGVIKSIGETLWSIGSFLIEGIGKGIAAAWNGFISWLGGLWNGFIDWIKNILGIHSPSTVMAEIGGWLIQGFLDGIQAVWNVLVAVIGGLLKGLGAIFSWLWDNVVKPVAEAIGAIFGWLWDSILKPIFTVIGDVWSALITAMGWYWENILHPALQVMGAIFSWLWDSVLKPVFAVIGDVWGALMTAMGWAWDNILKPVWNAIAAVISWLWDTILKVVFAFIQAEWQGLMIIMKWAWENILQPAWNAISTVAQWLWNNILKPIFGFIGDAWDLLIKGIGWAWDNILHPVWNAIATIAQWLWNNILSNIFKWIGDAWNALLTGIGWVWDHILHPVWDAISTVAQWLWNNILKPVFDAIGSAWDAMGKGFQWVHDHIIKPVFDAFSSVVQTVHDGFQTAVDGIGRIWDGLKSALGTPVQWVVDFVWNNGLRKLWNWINNLWGGDDLDEFKLNFARGGIMPGYTPGRDVHKFVSPTGGRLDLSGGEAIMRPEFTRAVGSGFVNGANAAAMRGGTAGVQDYLASVMGGPAQQFKKGGIIDLPGWLDTALNFVPGSGMVTDIIDKLNGGDTGGGSWGDMIWGMVKKTGSDVWDAVSHFFSGGDGDGNGGGGTGTAGAGSDQIKAFIRSVDPLPYIWGATGPNGYDCSGLAGEVFALMTGRPQFRRYFTTGSIGNGSQLGFKPGLGGLLNLGFNDHHVVGEYGGLGFEAQSTATGILTGAKATPPSRMPKQMHLATGGVLSKRDIDALTRKGIAVGGDSSGPVIGPDFYPNQAKRAAKDAGLFDQGGMMTGVGINLSGRPERVLSPGQTAAFERLVNILDGVDLVKLEARLNGSQTASQPVVYNYNGDTITININGDLSLPNITNGHDAETFITNLRDMAGGSRR